MKPSMKETKLEYDYTGNIVGIGSWDYGPRLVKIHHGIEDYALVYFLGEQPRWYKINYSLSGRDYIRINNRRYYFDECIRY